MRKLKSTHLPILLLTILYVTVMLYDHKESHAAGKEITIEGAVYHVHRADGSHKAYFDIVVDHSFPGKLPDDIDSITVTGPSGELPIGRNDFNYNPHWRAFWIVRPGLPELGQYSFKIVSGNSIGFATDVQSNIKSIPIPDVSRFKPSNGENDTSYMPTCSWSSINAPYNLFYQLQIREMNRKHVYRTDFVRDMVSVRIPPNLLKSERTYQWRVRVADDSNWVTLNNRSQSKWVTISKNQATTPCQFQYNAPTRIDDGWDTSSLQGENINQEKINELMLKILNGDIPDIHSVLIVKNGRLVLEEYFHGYARNLKHRMMSVSKSITSILIGIAVDQRKITNVDEKLYTFFPSYEDINWDVRKKEIRLKHALTMTAGLDWNAWIYSDGDMRDSTTAMTHSDDWIKFVLSRKGIDTPGKNFVYSNGLTILFGEIIRNATELSADKFAEYYLFKPLGISDFSWHVLPNGTVNTAWGLSLRPRDMAKIGYMMLESGLWNGKQVVSQSWVKESTNAHIKSDILLGSGYGYQWWSGQTIINNRNIKVFYAAGKGGQYIFVCPELDLVTVFTSKADNDSLGEFRPQVIMVKYILPAMLPYAPPRRTVELNSKIAKKYIGYYESKLLEMPLSISTKNDTLYYKSPDGEIGKIFPESETIFFGTSKEIGDFQAKFYKNGKGAITHCMVHVGFGGWRFDKIR